MSRSKLMKLTPAAMDEFVRHDFGAFIHRVMQQLSPGTRYRPNWHIDAAVHQLERARTGELTRLIINMPPRSLKSVVASVAFPAFLLGHNPGMRIICVSYGNDLAAKHARDFREVLTSPWYRRMFPNTRISPSKNTEAEIATKAGGFRLSTSTEGTLTGRGGDLIIIDDPLKPIDALSDSRRARANEWFRNTLLSRLDDKVRGSIVVVMQRVHLDDLTGNLLRSSPREWTLLELPAIAEERQVVRIGNGRDDVYIREVGEALHPEREPLHVLEKLRTQLGSDTFGAQYQQRPVPPGGAMVKRTWLRRYDQLPPKPWWKVVQSWDTASKEGAQNDYSVCTTWLVHENKHYLIDVVRGRHDYPGLKALAIAHADVHRPSRILIEDAGVGTALIAELKKTGRNAVAVKPERDKVSRMSVASAKFEAGQVLLPTQAPWLTPLEEELLSFPHGVHDDQVDSISQALNNPGSSYDGTLSWVDGEST